MDVFVYFKDLEAFNLGDEVTFDVYLNERGQPQGFNPRAGVAEEDERPKKIPRRIAAKR